MQLLTTLELMSVWEQGLSKSLVQRALILLSAACPDASLESLARLSIGQRDSRLLSLREQIFGAQLISIAHCPACSERLELLLQVADIQVPVLAKAAPKDRSRSWPIETSSIAALMARLLPRNISGLLRHQKALDRSNESFDLHIGNYEVQFRLPNSYDLLAIAPSDDLDGGRYSLLRNCLISVQQLGIAQPGDRLPEELVEAVAAKMAELDPQAEVLLSLDCPSCKHRWKSSFDIVSFFWSEINAWAIRLLREVHTLASAYGWRETDILTMNPYRRQFYLEMVGSR
jgi:hypothetical protein